MDDDPRRVPLTPERYDERWEALAATGRDVHGEVALVGHLLPPGSRVLDAGCGTGRVAIELARRGYVTTGIDVDADLLTRARAKAPALEWIDGDLATLDANTASGPFAAAVLAGNVMIFVAPGTESRVLANLAARLGDGGLIVAGFQLSGRLTVIEYDAAAAAAGLELVTRWSTWDRAPFTDTSDYVVQVHARSAHRSSSAVAADAPVG